MLLAVHGSGRVAYNLLMADIGEGVVTELDAQVDARRAFSMIAVKPEVLADDRTRERLGEDPGLSFLVLTCLVEHFGTSARR